MDHHIGHRKLAQIQHAAEHVAVNALHVAFAMQEIDGAAQFLAGRKDRLILSHVHAEPFKDPADEFFDPDQDRPEQPHHPLHRLCNREREYDRAR